MYILISNVGSTSLKFKLYRMPEEEVLCEAKIEKIGSQDGIYHYKNDINGRTNSEESTPLETYAVGINKFLSDLCDKGLGVIASVAEVQAIGFKTVISKGFNGTVLLTDEVMAGMKEYLFIAPVHNAAYISAIEQFRGILPDTPMVGVFETSFHRTIPLRNRLYPLPYEWYEKYGLAKNGYHGASFTYVSQEARRDGDFRRIIGCHLGGSSSICDILDGKSFDSSFGFSLQTGLPHANRCGDADPYVVPFLEDQGMSFEEIREGLDKKGGLLGISGVSNDLREIEEAAGAGNERAQLAIDVFVNDIVRYIGSFFAEMGGMDKLVFTGGIGENSSLIRRMVCDSIKHLGVELDSEQNDKVRGNGFISTASSPVKVQVIAANEELGIARETYGCLQG